MNAPHHAIIRHYERCLERFGDTHRGVDWPNADDAAKRYRVMLDLVRPGARPATLLDFGCGASHLYQYMLDNGVGGLRYAGLDASQAFCTLSQSKYPDNEYLCVDVLAEPERVGEFDYIVMNGVFTEKRELSFDDMHVAALERERVRDRDRFLAEALHVERDLLLALRDLHARVEDARLQHRADAFAQDVGVDVGRPGPDGASVLVEHAHEAIGQVARVGGGDVDGGFAHLAGWRQAQVRKIGLASRTPCRLRHMQSQWPVLAHSIVSTFDFVARFVAERNKVIARGESFFGLGVAPIFKRSPECYDTA